MAGKTRKHDAVVEALLSEPTIERAAEVSGVSARTIRRWLREDAVFKSDYRAARQAIFDAAITRLASLCQKAVEEIDAILTDPKAPRGAKLSACRIVFEQIRASQADDLEDRLQRIENMFECEGDRC